MDNVLLGPFFHFPFFIGIVMPLIMPFMMGLGGNSRSNYLDITPYVVGWVYNTIAAYYYYYYGWF